MTRYIFIMSLLLVVTSTRAEHIVKLEKVVLEIDSFGFYIEDVIIGQKEKDCIGFVLRRPVFRKVTAFFPNEIKQELQSLFNRSIKKEPGSKPLIIRINKLLIYEYIYNSTKYSFVDLSMNFIVKQDSIFYNKFLAGVSLSSFGFSYNKIIANAFETCMTDFKNRARENKLKNQVISKEELLTIPSIEPKNFPVLKPKKLTKGIYNSFYDFIDNNVDTNNVFSIDDGGKKSSKGVVSLNFKKAKPDKDIWGFCDGQTIYMRIKKNYYPLLRKNNDFTVKCKPSNAGSNAVIGSAAEPGIGGALFTILAVATEKWVNLKIDLLTGNLVLLDDKVKQDFNGLILFYYSKYSKIKLELCLEGNSEKLCCITTGEFCELILPISRENIRIDINAPGDIEHSFNIVPNELGTQFFRIKLKKDKSIVIDKLKNELKKAFLEIYESEQESH